MDSSRSFGIMVPARVYGGLEHNERKQSGMNATTVAVDLAKNVFELAVADAGWKVVDKARLTRSQFAR